MVMLPEYFKEFQRFWEEYLKLQKNFVDGLLSVFDLTSKFSILREDIAIFRAKVQSGGRISIPETDRLALNIKEGDIVKVIVIKDGGEQNGV